MPAAVAIPPELPRERRLVADADEARRRLERDLHEGAQQQLALASLTLRRAALDARGTPAEPLVSEAMTQLRQGLADLRALARGIYPAALVEHGLAPALEGLAARTPLAVDLRVTRERVHPATEAAVYFTVAESLADAATRASVDVGIDEARLAVVIDHDGPRGDEPRRELADRLGALGGTLTVEGTSLRATVPLT